MDYPLIIGPEAEAELERAQAWYEQQRAGLGCDFLQSVSDTFGRVAQNPQAFAEVYKHVRQALIKRFPYVVCYTFNGRQVFVLAVFHGHRDPNEWMRRLQ